MTSRAEAGSIFGVELDRAEATAQTTRHVGLDIDHKFQPLSSDRALVGKDFGAWRPSELARELCRRQIVD